MGLVNFFLFFADVVVLSTNCSRKDKGEQVKVFLKINWNGPWIRYKGDKSFMTSQQRTFYTLTNSVSPTEEVEKG